MSSEQDKTNRQRFPPPPPFNPQQQSNAQQQGYSAASASSYGYTNNSRAGNPSNTNMPSSFTNPYYSSQPASTASYYNPSGDVSIAMGESKMSKRPSAVSQQQQSSLYYGASSVSASQYSSASQHQTGSSAYDTLKSRSTSNVNYPTQNYLLTKPTSITATTKLNNNGSISLILLPSLTLLLLSMPSSLPLLLFLMTSLIIYGVDLANFGGYYTLFGVWSGWGVVSGVVGWFLLVDGVAVGDDNGGRYSLGSLVVVCQLFVSMLLLFCLATWSTLQFQWLPHQIPHIARLLERILHFTLPPTSAAIIAYGVTSSPYNTLGVDSLAILLPYIFAGQLALGVWMVGSAPSMFATDDQDQVQTYNKEDKKNKVASLAAISPREGRLLSNLLVFGPMAIHLTTFRQRIFYSYASYDDLFDLLLVATVPYLMHYLLACRVLDEQWRRSLNWLLKAGTSKDGRTIRGAVVPMVFSLLASISFQQRYLISLCAWASYIMNGHEGVISSTLATTFLTCGTLLMYATFWFFGRQNEDGTYLLGEYHEDVFQLLLGGGAVCLGLSCSPPWSFLPIPMLFAESVALWVISKQLRYASLTIFVFFTCSTLLIAYRLTFLNEMVEIVPNKRIRLKAFAQYAMSASMLLLFFIGLVHRAPGGVLEVRMKKWDTTGICFTIYSLFLVVLEFALLRCPMPVYSRDNYEVGRVAVYSTMTAYLSGFLSLIIMWHLYRQKLTKLPSTIIAVSITIGKMLAVLIEEKLLDGDDSLRMIYIRWAVTTILLITISVPYILSPVHVKMSVHAKRSYGPSGKPRNELPKNASVTVALYCGIILPLVILVSVRLVVEPLVGILIGYGNSAFYYASPKLSEVIGYSASLWGLAVLQMINHFLPDGGADVMRRLSALIFVMGLFVSFSAPAIPGTSTSVEDSLYKSVSSLDTDDGNSSGGWGLISSFLAILLAITGPLELREIRDSSGRRDTRQLLRLMIFGTMFGCGLAWFITRQSMNKDIFIPIFVTSFSTMAMSFLGTVCSVMGYFLEAKDFGEASQIANVWAGVGFPVFFVISSVSLSAHAHPFGIGGWASTYLSVCGLLAGAFTILVRMRDEKTSTTRGYGNASCTISWLCAIAVIYGRYGVAGVGVVGTTSVAGIPMSVLGTFLCAPILILLEGEPPDGSKKQYQVSSSKSQQKGLVLPTLTRSNWFAPLLAGTVGTFVLATVYAIFLRGCGLSKFSLLFGTVDVTKNQDDIFSLKGSGKLDDVALLARKSVVHTQTMISAARLNGSGIWTAKNFVGPLLHSAGLLIILPSLHYIVTHSWSGKCPPAGKLTLLLPLSILSMFIGKGIPSLAAAASIAFVGGLMQISSSKR